LLLEFAVRKKGSGKNRERTGAKREQVPKGGSKQNPRARLVSTLMDQKKHYLVLLAGGRKFRPRIFAGSF
jgi:hypothetical protein